MNVGILRSDKDYDKMECFSCNSFTELWKQLSLKNRKKISDSTITRKINKISICLVMNSPQITKKEKNTVTFRTIAVTKRPSNKPRSYLPQLFLTECPLAATRRRI